LPFAWQRKANIAGGGEVKFALKSFFYIHKTQQTGGDV
jgi:hypothetical protein